jgi:O-antigen ligase
MTPRGERLDRLGFICLAASLGLVPVKLLAAQVAFGIAALLWLWLTAAERQRTSLPPFTWPLAAYAGLTLMSAAFSILPRESRIDCKQLLLFLIVPVTAAFARGDRATRTLNVIIAVGAAGAVLGVAEYAIFGFDVLERRPTGSLSHYMTYSGVIMLVLGAALARLLFHTGSVVWPAIAVPALLVAITVTYARNAWLGTLAAMTCLLGVRRPRLMVVTPILVVLFFVIAPAGLRSRATSMFDVREASNRDRLQMLEMGREMVRDHPVFGVGPEMVGRVYGQYLRPDPVHIYNPHLHNVPVQIAAERGLPALGAWLAFIITAVWTLARQFRQARARALAAAGLAAIAATLVAGLFEYNFGDSEFLMLFLGLITLPFAALQPDTREPRTT